MNTTELHILIENREHLIALEKEFIARSSAGGVHLNLGCGTRVFDKWINIDADSGIPNIHVDDITQLNTIEDGTVDSIFSAHVLEHLPIRAVRKVFMLWTRKLKIGGQILISMPDIDLICYEMVNPATVPERRAYLRYCMYGYQAPMDEPDNTNKVDPMQFHISGWSLSEIESMIKEASYDIIESKNYEGYGTPGLYVFATYTGMRMHLG